MERFLSPLRDALPDVDIDVESARRTEVYEQILDRFGGERVACVSMMDTYRVRHAIRDVGAALGMPPGEIDRSPRRSRTSGPATCTTRCASCPSCGPRGSAGGQLDLLFRLVERLDGLPRHIALHPCGVLLSDTTLLDRTPVEASWLGFPMSQFDKDDVEELGLLKLDVLGIRMQSAMAHAIDEVRRVDGTPDDPLIDLDDQEQVPLDDPDTFALIQSTRTLGMFQIESPGQRELVGKFGARDVRRPHHRHLAVPARPGQERHGHAVPAGPAGLGRARVPARGPALRARGDLRRRRLPRAGAADRRDVHRRHAGRGRRGAPRPGHRRTARPRSRCGCGRAPSPAATTSPTVDKVWEVLKAFASFGFCKAHAAAFALPTYQSAWLKAHHPAAFLAGVLTHDPGMYPKRLILDDARQFGIAVLRSTSTPRTAYRSRGSPLDEPPPAPRSRRGSPDARRCPTARAYGIRLALAEVKGISEAEVARVVAGRPYALAGRLLAPRRGVPPGGRAAGAHRRLRRALRAGVGGHRPVRPAAAG